MNDKCDFCQKVATRGAHGIHEGKCFSINFCDTCFYLIDISTIDLDKFIQGDRIVDNIEEDIKRNNRT